MGTQPFAACLAPAPVAASARSGRCARRALMMAVGVLIAVVANHAAAVDGQPAAAAGIAQGARFTLNGAARGVQQVPASGEQFGIGIFAPLMPDSEPVPEIFRDGFE